MNVKSENLFETGMTVAFSNLYRKIYFSEGASVEVTGIYILPGSFLFLNVCQL